MDSFRCYHSLVGYPPTGSNGIGTHIIKMELIKMEHSSKWNTHQNGTLIKKEHSYQNGTLIKMEHSSKWNPHIIIKMEYSSKWNTHQTME